MTGKSVEDLVAEVKRQLTLKQDYIVPTDKLVMDDAARLNFGEQRALPVQDYAHAQVASYLKIPYKYYQRMQREAPVLLADNVNTWFRKQGEPRMIRTLDGRVRAFLSDRYQRRDNFDLLHKITPVLENQDNDLQLVSCEITEIRMYLKFVVQKITAKVGVGDVVQSGAVISNSEVGGGAVSVLPYVNRLVCMNGMIVPEMGIRKYHIGRRLEEDEEDAYAIYSDETRKADDEAFWLKIRDTIVAVTQQDKFDLIVGKLRDAHTQGIENPAATVHALANKYSMSEDEEYLIVSHLKRISRPEGEGGEGLGHTRYALVNAITSAAKDVEDYDRGTELQTMGGMVLDLPRSEWVAVNGAA